MPGPTPLDPQGGPLPQLKKNGWFPSNIAWQEYTGRSNPLPHDMGLSYDGGNQAVYHIIIYATDLFTAVSDLLGTNRRDPLQGNIQNVSINGNIYSLTNLLRNPPMVHPVLQWLYCSRIASIKEYVTMTSTDPKKDQNQPIKAPWPGANFSGNTALNITTAVPRFLILTCLFQQPKYRVLSDATLAAPQTTDMVDSPWHPNGNAGATFRAEYERYLEGWPRSRVETITQEARTAFFVETGTGQDAQNGGAQIQGANGPLVGPGGGVFGALVNNGQPFNPATGTGGGPVSFPSPWPSILKKADLVKRWKRVPAVGLLDDFGTGRAVMLDLALQTVDAGDQLAATGFGLFNYPIGTLKFEGYQLTPLESPIQPNTLPGNAPPLGMGNIFFDVDLAWSFFDPPWDLTAMSAANAPPWTGGPSRGHNLGPWRGVVAGDRTGNNLWYRIGGSAPTGNKPGANDGDPLLFPYFDQRLMFCMLTG
jgi:hypothetical protein